MSEEETKGVPRALYYMAIDGTSAVDSVVYGELLERELGWRNLVGEFLAPAADDPTRLHDPAHPYLPICVYKAKTASKKVAVICPHGRESAGREKMWQKYAGELPSEQPEGRFESDIAPGLVTYGRASAAEKSAIYMKELLLNPSFEVVEENGALVRRLATAEVVSDDREHGTAFSADLLIVSSHGWLGGWMKGNMVGAWKEAEPESAREEFIPFSPYFLVGEAAMENVRFTGPRWIILAQCSTLNMATWPLWARVLFLSDPPVRGILAYEESSPSAEGSIPIARNFIKYCKTMTVLDAWKKANKRIKWAALVHKNAVDDRLGEWREFVDPEDTTTDDTTSNYRGYLSGLKDGVDVFDKQPPFELVLSSIKPRTASPRDADSEWLDITPDKLCLGRAYVIAERYGRVIVYAPTGRPIVSARIRLVHIRRTYRKQCPVSSIFQTLEPRDADVDRVRVAFDPKDKYSIEVESLVGPVDSLTFHFRAATERVLGRSVLEMHHSYLWLAVAVTLADGTTLENDFTTTGLSF